MGVVPPAAAGRPPAPSGPAARSPGRKPWVPASPPWPETEGAAHDLTGAAEKDPGTRLGLARSLDWLSGHRVRRGDNAVALSGQFGRFEVATGLLTTQEVRFELKTERLTTQEVRFDVKRSFRLPKRQSARAVVAVQGCRDAADPAVVTVAELIGRRLPPPSPGTGHRSPSSAVPPISRCEIRS
jgi:hypothetical protein